MKLLFRFLFSFLIAELTAEPIITGNSKIESANNDSDLVNISKGKFLLEREMLQNPSFETGSLYPWTTNNWIVDTIYPHQGRYCASVVGNYWIRQNVRPMPSGYITHVTFWARQPEAPAAQAYDFIYNDSTIEEFVHFPTAEWAQYDVTANLNQQKILVAFRLWGYSGGGPNPDSTYIDDVSITRRVDVVITSIFSPTEDTFHIGDTIRPRIRMSNSMPFTESLWVWFKIDHTCSSYTYCDSSFINIPPGLIDVEFAPWIPRYTGQYRFRFELSPNDTTPWYYFWIVEGIAIKENNDLLLSNKIIVRPTIGKSFEFVCEPKIPKVLKIYNSAGELVWTKKISAKEPFTVKWFGKDQLNRGLSPGVYILSYGDVTKRIMLAK